MKIIYQIGRLDSQMRPLRFTYEGNEYENELSSFALKEHLRDDTKVVLIYPVSLPFNRTLNPSFFKEEFKNKVEKIFKGDNKENILNYFNDPQDFFKDHPHSKIAVDFILIHSIGEYENVKFEGTYDDIVLEILFDMIKRAIDDEIEELYIDISSGLNIYVSALLEAMRHFAIFDQLQKLSNTSKCKIYKVFSDPIIGTSATLFQIYKTEVKFKVFFSSPIKKEDIDNYNLAKKLTVAIFQRDEREFKRKVQKNLENFAIHFSALKNAIPLANFTFELNEVSEIKNLMKEIIKTAEDERIHIDWRKSPALPKDDFLKVLLSLSFYIGIVKILKNGVNLRRDEEGMDIDSIENFKKIYEALGLTLNSTFLGKEVYNLKEGKDEQENTLKNKATEEWSSLSSFIEGLQSEVDERNFFAHAGFERNITEVRKSEEKLYFRYKENMKETIKGFLKNNI